MKGYMMTAESVTEGHPDKLCDQISDGILDAYLEQDPYSYVAVETLVSKGVFFIAGEITSNGVVDIAKVAKNVCRNIGYTSEESGLDCDNCMVFTNIHTQSTDIARGVGHTNGTIGAGDQGIMYGYACDESETYMPLPHYLATKLCMRLAEVRKMDIIPWLYPDGKSQVTIMYDNDGTPKYIASIVVSAHHKPGVPIELIRESILKEVILSTVGDNLLTNTTKIHINPTGSFAIGGPAADTGVTGRKLMVDTYGGMGKHGGGAFSGKDSTKVDRSGAYMARYIAKNIVSAKLAKRCEVVLAYAIGQSNPEALTIDTFGTEQIPLDLIQDIVKKNFSCSVGDIIEILKLRQTKYIKTASYGHFGRENLGFRWEDTDKAEILRKEVIDIKSRQSMKTCSQRLG